MEEKIYVAKKNGLKVLILTSLLLLIGIVAIVLGALMIEGGNDFGGVFVVVGILIDLVGWIPYCGLKILKPQEALVLTLFGKI